mgnify:CR=1 FL=1
MKQEFYNLKINTAGQKLYEFTDQTLNWIKKNKPYSKNYWMDSWNSYALSIRIVIWISEISRRNSSLNQSDLKALHCLMSLLYFYLNLLYLNNSSIDHDFFVIIQKPYLPFYRNMYLDTKYLLYS